MAQDDPIVGGVDFVTLPTADYAAAARFYGQTLGLRCSVTYERVPGGEFETGNLTLQLIDSSAAGGGPGARGYPVALHVQDVDGARAQLEVRGVAFSGETLDTGVCRMAFFEDPDGNALMLHNRYAPR
jgi:predicted enzyme related to lactoylglutathione lyase